MERQQISSSEALLNPHALEFSPPAAFVPPLAGTTAVAAVAACKNQHNRCDRGSAVDLQGSNGNKNNSSRARKKKASKRVESAVAAAASDRTNARGGTRLQGSNHAPIGGGKSEALVGVLEATGQLDKRGLRWSVASRSSHAAGNASAAKKLAAQDISRRTLPGDQATAAPPPHGSVKCPSNNQPRDSGKQHRRRARNGRTEPNVGRSARKDGRTFDSGLRPKGAPRFSEVSGSVLVNGSSGSHRRGRATPASDSQTRSIAHAAKSATTKHPPRSELFRTTGPTRDSAGCFLEAGGSKQPLTVLPNPDEKREEENNAFPALPIVAKCRESPPVPLLSFDAPEERPAAASLNYSSLTEKLAAEAAAAARAARRLSTSPKEVATEDGDFLRLSVLPAFGKDRQEAKESRRDNSNSVEHLDSLVESHRALKFDVSRPTGVIDYDGTGSTRELPSLSPLELSLPPPPPQATLAVLSGKDRQRQCAATVAATVALRARLRERWFRLEAARKVERHREAAERGLMAREDRFACSHPTYSRDGGCGRGYCEKIDSSGRRRQQDRLMCRHSVGLVDGFGTCDARGLSDDAGIDSISGDDNDSSIGGPSRSPVRASPAGSTTSMVVQAAADETALVELRSDTKSASCSSDSDNDGTGSSTESAQASKISPSQERRPLSAPGTAAIRRAEAAAAAAAAVQAPTVTSTLTGLDLKMMVQNIDEKAKSTGGETLQQDKNGDDRIFAIAIGTGSDVDGVSVVPKKATVDAACESGTGELLNDLFVRSGGRAADVKDKLRRTPLHLAAEMGDLECVKKMLKQGTQLDSRDRWRETPLHKAARAGNSDVVKALCTSRMKVNVRNRRRETPLLLAVRADAGDAVAALLSFGARLDDPDIDGVTPVCEAAINGQTELLMTMVSSNKACRKSSREPPFLLSAKTGLAGSSCYNSNINNNRGNASRQRALLLLPSSASPDHHHQGRHQYGSSVLRNAPNNGSRVTVGTAKGLQNNTAAASPSSSSAAAAAPARSVVHEAVGAGQVETLSLLLLIGVSFEERDMATWVGDTPLGRAVRDGRLSCARLLLDAGAMIDRENARGETPLVVAIKAGRASAVELLAQRGAALDGGLSHGRLSTSDGRVPTGARQKMMARRMVEPLELALRERQLACAAIMIEGGARISERALRAMKLEPKSAVAAERDRSRAQGRRAIYAGTTTTSPSEHCNGGGSNIGGDWILRGSTTSATIASSMLLPLQSDIADAISPELAWIADSAPLDGGGLEVDYATTPHGFDNDQDQHDDVRSVMSGVNGFIASPWQQLPKRLPPGNREKDSEAARIRMKLKKEKKFEYIGGLMRSFGHCDAVLVVEDGSRIPVHACLLAAFSGTFRDLFALSPQRSGCFCWSRHHRKNGSGMKQPSSCGSLQHSATKRESGLSTATMMGVNDEPTDIAVASIDAAVKGCEEKDHRRTRVRDIQALLAFGGGNSSESAGATSGVVARIRSSSAQPATRATPVAAATAAMAVVASLSATPSATAAFLGKTSAALKDDYSAPKCPKQQQESPLAPLVVGWAAARGEIIVRFWGAGTMAAVVRHVYTGQPPMNNQNMDSLGRLLAAAVSLRMPRLMRQVEHLLSAMVPHQKKGGVRRPTVEHGEVARLLRGARALGVTTDLEERCTLYLQANGTFPAVMKLRRELGIPSVNASDVSRGVARLSGSGYLGSGPAHAWSSSSSAAVPSSASFSSASVAAVKRAVDLPLRKRAVNFDQLMPLLLDPARCSEALSVGQKERYVLVATALADACPGNPPCKAFSSDLPGVYLNKTTAPPAPPCDHCLQQPPLLRRSVSNSHVECDAPGSNTSGCYDGGVTAMNSDEQHREMAFQPLASNFSAFSHGMGWLLRTGAVADLVLVLPIERNCDDSDDDDDDDGDDDDDDSGDENSGGAMATASVESTDGVDKQPKEHRGARWFSDVEGTSTFVSNGGLESDKSKNRGGSAVFSGGMNADRPNSYQKEEPAQEVRGGSSEDSREQTGGEGMLFVSRGDENMRGKLVSEKGKDAVRKKKTAAAPRFLAHSMVLGARSEKFAAMLRFVRRQDDAVDGDHGCSDDTYIDSSSNAPREACIGENDQKDASCTCGSGINSCLCCLCCGPSCFSCNCGIGGATDAVVLAVGEIPSANAGDEGPKLNQDAVGNDAHIPASRGGLTLLGQEAGTVESEPELERRRRCEECLQREESGSAVVSSASGSNNARHSPHQNSCCACRRWRQQHYSGQTTRCPLPPRELELHSPLLSPRSLALFLEFLYTGVLNPVGLSTRELSELALIGDEYLVPDLMSQVEVLLVECLAPRSSPDDSWSRSTSGFSSEGMAAKTAAAEKQMRGGGTGTTHFTAKRSKQDEVDKAPGPLEFLQLGVSLGLRDLSSAAARSVLLQLEEVSISEAFGASGMTKRELVLAALEAARSF